MKIRIKITFFAVMSLVFLYSMVMLLSTASFVLDLRTSRVLTKKRIKFRVIMVTLQNKKMLGSS